MKPGERVPKIICVCGGIRKINLLYVLHVLELNKEAQWRERDCIDQLWKIQWGQHGQIQPTQTWANRARCAHTHTHTTYATDLIKLFGQNSD